MKEIRLNNNISTDSRKVSGYAVVFNSLSEDLGGFREIILPSAITQETINNSDIIFLLDHKQDRGILARSTKGEGSLRLSVDDKGLYFEFEAPNTALGDELLEGLKRHDYSKCSFAFTVGEDEYKKDNNGTVIRTIKSIRQLYDCSVVVNPAYEETSVTVDERGLQKFLSDNNSNIDINNMAKISKRSKRSNEEILKEIKSLMAEMEESEERVEEVEEEVKDTDTTDETTDNSNEEKEEDIEDKNCETDTDKPEDRKETEEEKVSEEVEEKEDVVEDTTEDKEEINNENRNINTSMKFKLIKTINDIVNNRGLDDAAKAVNKEGRSAMVKAGFAANGNITIPIEHREDPVTPAKTNGILATVSTQGKENVATDKLNILEPLRANMVLAKAGATYMTGLVGDVSIPVYSGSNVGWKGEVVAADNGEGAFSEVVLQPKRLTAFVDVSKQFLIQDSNDAEEMLKRDIINAIGEKLEQTVLGSDAGDTTKPAGAFNGVTVDTAAVKFDTVVDMEASLEEANVNDYCYIVSPSAKAILRKTSKDSGSGQFIMQDGEIEGREVYVSSAVVKKGVVVGDFKDYVVAQWGGLDLTVDPYTKASEGMIRLVINAYFDAKPRRAEAFVKRILK